MSKQKNIYRRDFLKLAGLGAGALALNSALASCQKIAAVPTALLPAALPTSTPVKGVDGLVELNIRAAKSEIQILDGEKTRVWQFQSELIQGDAGALTPIPNSYLAPVVRIRQGQTFRARLTNELDQKTIIHWHGMKIPEAMDGHPRLVIAPGKTYDYEFKVINRAGTYWFHPHPHMMTGGQVYNGMAGLFIVHDESESALGLPDGDFDVPLVIQDRIFDANNQFSYTGDSMTGFLGDKILVNGAPDFKLKVATRPYRLRLLNGSNARIYKLAWSDDSPFTVIGTDGGLLEKPIQRDFIMLAPAQRIELWVDFSGRKVGEEIVLKSQPFVAGFETGMMGGLSTQGAPFDILTVSVEEESTRRSDLPSVLSSPNFYQPQDAARTRTIQLNMQMMTGTLNGRTFVMDEVANDEKVNLDDLEIWEFANIGRSGVGMMGGGGMMSQPHPMHMHAVQFKIIERVVDNPQMAVGYDEVRNGFVDDGWMDTVLTWPGERVRVLVKFEHYAGLYLYHCHNLEHEDGGMMRNFEILA
ncbi:MAG: multicopper oxidase family protein [Anaerolineales bacterium]|nr:multicopper oxidase family protein [Anaerolineales bacterium]